MPAKKSAGSAVEAIGHVLEAVDGLEEKDQLWVFRSALDKLQLTLGAQTPRAGGAGFQPPANATSSGAVVGNESPPEFFRLKKPDTDLQRVACLAYYLTKYRNTPVFKVADLSKLQTETRTPKFNLGRAADKATRNAKFLTSVSGHSKQITTHGEDVVEALPDQEAVKEVMKNQKGGRKRPKRSARKGSKRA